MLKQYLTLILGFSVVVLFQLTDINAENLINDFLSPRIINGTDADLNAGRHQVSIRTRLHDSLSFGNGHSCGGSLISENFVLSAAHCFIDSTGPKPNGSFLPEKDFIVVMGTLDRLEYNNNTLVFDILKIVKHDKNFNLTTLGDDIVLVMLNGRVPANHPTIKQITLNEGPIKNNTICQATGWGINETVTYVRPEKLQVVAQPYINFNDCRNKSLYGSQVREGMLCAGFLEGGRGPCTADSGGPLVCRGIQAGIVSWGGACATPLNPTVYADVAYYKEWILKEVSQLNGTLPKFASIPDGVTGLNCSIILVSLMFIINFLFGQLN